MSISVLRQIVQAHWLARVLRQYDGLQPMLLEKGSGWRVGAAGALLGRSQLTLLPFGASDGETVTLADVASVLITEDASERYLVELKFKSEAEPPATLVLGDDLYLMMVIAALNRLSVHCGFSFTRARLKELGAIVTKGARTT